MCKCTRKRGKMLQHHPTRHIEWAKKNNDIQKHFNKTYNSGLYLSYYMIWFQICESYDFVLRFITRVVVKRRFENKVYHWVTQIRKYKSNCSMYRDKTSRKIGYSWGIVFVKVYVGRLCFGG